MELDVAELKQQLTEIQKRPSMARRYPAALRNGVVAYAKPLVAEGRTFAAVSGSLGIQAVTLQKWFRAAGTSSPFLKKKSRPGAAKVGAPSLVPIRVVPLNDDGAPGDQGGFANHQVRLQLSGCRSLEFDARIPGSALKRLIAALEAAL